MQNSVKGLVCSLLHQALPFANNVLPSVLATFPLLINKDEHTDWSLEELSSVFTAVFNSYPAPICVFIDGLDEICEKDGVRPLMKIVQDLRSIPNIKVCLSSRPEPRFLKLLGNQQHIRLQDLTAKYMMHFAYMSLKPYLKRPTTEVTSYELSQEYLLSSLTDKAEGVFLWLHLAIQSLIRGFEHGDDEEDLLRRLEVLPGGLTALYSEMWMRLNDDAPLYREFTARYLNLMLDAQDVSAKKKVSSYHYSWGYLFALTGRMSLFALVASAHLHIQEVFLDERGIMPASQLEDLCAKTRNSVLLRCAGLVEMLHSTQAPHYGSKLKAMSEYGILKVHLDSYLVFVHRTAYDFLKYTEEGQRILRHDPTSEVQRHIQLARGKLVRSRISSHVGIFRGWNCMRSALISVSLIEFNTLEQQRELLYLCEKWYDNGYLRCREVHLGQPKPHFLAVVASCGLDEFVRSQLTLHAASSSLATLILSDIVAPERIVLPFMDQRRTEKLPGDLYTGYMNHTNEASLKLVNLIKHLLRLHSDTNARPG